MKTLQSILNCPVFRFILLDCWIVSYGNFSSNTNFVLLAVFIWCQNFRKHLISHCKTSPRLVWKRCFKVFEKSVNFFLENCGQPGESLDMIMCDVLACRPLLNVGEAATPQTMMTSLPHLVPTVRLKHRLKTRVLFRGRLESIHSQHQASRLGLFLDHQHRRTPHRWVFVCLSLRWDHPTVSTSRKSPARAKPSSRTRTGFWKEVSYDRSFNQA